MERVFARASGRDNPSESRNPRLSLKNLHVRDRPILAGASGQVSVPDLRNSFCWKVDPSSPPVVGGYLHTRMEAVVEGDGRL